MIKKEKQKTKRQVLQIWVSINMRKETDKALNCIIE